MSSDVKHTAEPWYLGNGDIYAEGTKQSDYDDRVICAIGVGGGFRSHEYSVIRAHKPEGKANANRIVDCVNALAGITNPSTFMEQHKKLVEAAEALRNAVCGETGFASAVRLNSGSAYPWPALDIAEEKLNAAIAALKGEA